MDIRIEQLKAITRRHFFERTATGIGAAALASLANERLFAADSATKQAGGLTTPDNPLAPKPPHFAGKAKHVIYLHMAGSPSQLDLFDYKPKLNELNGQPCPESLFKKERFAFIKGVPKMLGTPHKFAKHGQCGAEFSNLLPHLATVVDDLAIVKSMYTDQFNHAPAQLFLNTGSRTARPAQHGSLAHLRTGQREPEPARLRRADLVAARPRRRHVALGQRLPAERVSRRAVPLAGRSGALRLEPAGHGRGAAAANARRAPPAERAAAPRDSAIRKRSRASRSTRWPTACRPACPS